MARAIPPKNDGDAKIARTEIPAPTKKRTEKKRKERTRKAKYEAYEAG